MSTSDADVDDGRMRALVAEAGRRLQEMSPRIVGEMTELLSTRVKGLDQDPQLVELLQASIEGNVWTLGHILINEIGVDSMQPNTAAVEYAARLAQRDVSLGSLTRAYYLGQAMLVRRGIDAVDLLQLEDKRVQMNLVRLVTDVTHGYIDWILNYVTEVHVEEQRKWWAARVVTNAATVLKVLRKEQISVSGFETETRYSLEQHHVGLIAWREFDTEHTQDQQRIDQLIRRIARVLHSARPPLVIASDRLTAWAWVAVPSREPRLDAVQRIEELMTAEEVSNVRLAVGNPGTGVDGFRRSHEQAMKARLVALGSRRYRGERVVAFADPDVGLLSLIMNDQKGAANWTREVLGSVAARGESNALLRETLGTFYMTGENVTRTAELLGMHRNTVRQRVNRFVSERGASRTDGLQIAIALKLFDLLGDEPE